MRQFSKLVAKKKQILGRWS